MCDTMQESRPNEEGSYAVVGVPSKDANKRIKNVMKGLQSKFGGPQFDPHLTIVGPLTLTRKDALEKFKAASHGLKAYPAQAKAVSSGNSYWQSVFLLLESTPEVVGVHDHVATHFDDNTSTPYMPHISLLYGELSDEEKHEALEEAKKLDTIDTMCFSINYLQLFKLTLGDLTLDSWIKVAEHKLGAP